ncbi:MAG: hypothetical protein Q9195_004946 [Heterodermia aff. obscurata]
MLYYSGHTRRIGNVDDGSTVTDFLPAERARGVTIQSAAITFHWPPETPGDPRGKSDISNSIPYSLNSSTPHTINLIDTPGHADFAFEVIRSLRILDGAVCILDAVAGVEAQTEKVWNQAASYQIPKIIFINKLDRNGAAFGKTIKQIASRLHTWPAVCQIPIYEEKGTRFVGVADAINLRLLKWAGSPDGKCITALELDDLDGNHEALGIELRKARAALVEIISEYDDEMVEKYLEYEEDHLAIPSADIIASLRRCTLNPNCNIVPIFAGASFRNIGVQPLLDAVVNLLPSPGESPDPEVSMKNINGKLSALISGKLLPATANSAKGSKKSKGPTGKPNTALIQNLDACALAFKVVIDPRRGALVYVRVYSGSIRCGTNLYNTNLQVSERAQRLLKMYAQDSVDIQNLPAGQIGVIPGLKHTRTGDTLISYAGVNPHTGPPAPLNSLQLRPIEVPPAVFFSSIESHSLGEDKAVSNALALLIREDPSLHLSVDEDSGQRHLSGAGDFHLEIARDRLVNDLKAKANLGKIEIAYRESILTASAREIFNLDQETASRVGKAGCVATVQPLAEYKEPNQESDEQYYSTVEDGNRITITITGNPPSHLSIPQIQSALKSGAIAALSRGVNHGFPLINTHASITMDLSTHSDNHTSATALSSAARLATKAALVKSALEGGSVIKELVMNVTVSVDEASFGAVMNDISSARGGQIVSLDDGDPSGASSEVSQIDTSKVYAPPDPFEFTVSEGVKEAAGTTNRQRTIVARVPLEQMVGYLKHLRSLSAGRGTFVMSPDKFERVVGQREKELLKRLKGY